MLPCGRLELALRIANQGLGKALGAPDKVEAETALGAEEVVVDATLIAVIGADNFRAVVSLTDTKRHLAAIGTVGTNG